MTDNLALRDFLAENYSTYAEVKELWARVGGNTGRILDQTDSRSRWTALIQQMTSGAVPRLKFLTEVLNDYKGSQVIINALAQELTIESLSPAQKLVEQISRADSIRPIDIDFSILNGIKPEQIAPAIAVQVFQATPEEKRQFKLNLDTLKDKGTAAILGATANQLMPLLISGAHWALGGQ